MTHVDRGLLEKCLTETRSKREDSPFDFGWNSALRMIGDQLNSGRLTAPGDAGLVEAWKRPILYTDTINGQQACRDDLWAITTHELSALSSPRAAVGWNEWEHLRTEEYDCVVSDIKSQGHTDHCAKRIVYGDGQCECSP